jgi:hypothetical protein
MRIDPVNVKQSLIKLRMPGQNLDGKENKQYPENGTFEWSPDIELMRDLQAMHCRVSGRAD